MHMPIRNPLLVFLLSGLHLTLAAPSLSPYGAEPSSRAGVNVAERQSSIPTCVLQYAPLCWLASVETFYPSDIDNQVANTTPKVNSVAVSNAPAPLTLSNLNALNSDGNDGLAVYLTSGIETVVPRPAWLHGIKPNANLQTVGITSCAIITVDKGSGLLDAFYFYFYAYNRGDDVLGLESLQFGDHIGDWEHNMVRFQDGMPQAIWYSQHSDGEAFTYSAVQKNGARPINFVANGTHANYGTSGTHDHTLPDSINLPTGPLEDHTDAGTLWDPTLAAYTYSYDNTTNTFTSYGSDPVGWLYFNGHWGDAQLPASESGQEELFGEYKYVDGPTGPIFKALNRTAVCPDASGCVVRPILTV